MKNILTSCIVAISFAGSAFAANLSNDARITRELTAAAVADEIRNNCSTIQANMVSGLNKAWALKSYAKSLGASDSDIKAFLDSSNEQSRIKGLRDAYLAKNGVVAGDEKTYCALGKREMAQGSLIGSLLR